MRKPPRFYADYRQLEEYHAGMWRRIAGEDARTEWLARAVAHLRDQEAFRAAMARVLVEWPTSCLHNCTNPSLNKPVWLAHAGAALVAGIPEEMMRLGYWQLGEYDRTRADADAQELASRWRDPRVDDAS